VQHGRFLSTSGPEETIGSKDDDNLVRAEMRRRKSVHLARPERRGCARASGWQGLHRSVVVFV
jgi:hypothetical protein